MPGRQDTGTDAQHLTAVLSGPGCTINVGHPSPVTCANETNNDCHTIAAYITVMYFMRSLQQQPHKSPHIQCALKMHALM